MSLCRFQKHVDGSEPLSSDLKSAVFTIAMANGDETTFNQLVEVCVPVCMHVCVHVRTLYIFVGTCTLVYLCVLSCACVCM